jgi:hypothetical protein
LATFISKQISEQKILSGSQVCWWILVIPSPRKWRQEDPEFRATLDYKARPCPQKKKKKKISNRKMYGKISK